MPVLLPHERIGTTVAGRYRLDRILGRGGMGVVFAGQHVGTERPVAVKVLLPQFGENEDVKRRFFKEARAAARIRHPSVVDVLDLGEAADGSLFIVLELLEGQSLEERLAPDVSLDAPATLQILLPILDALAEAHDCAILHRDIKPPNIFLSVDGRGQTVPEDTGYRARAIATSCSGRRREP